MKYRGMQYVFEDKLVPIQLRLKLFDAVVTSTVLYSLETCPLSESLGTRLDVVQRKMLRRMVGWVSSSGDSWEDIGRRMKNRLQQCLDKSPVIDWSEAVYNRKSKCFNSIDAAPLWISSDCKWDLVACSSANFADAYRSVGRPFM